MGRMVLKRPFLYLPHARNGLFQRPEYWLTITSSSVCGNADVPIIMAEQCDVKCGKPNAKDKFIRALYEKLLAERWKNLVYLPKDEMFSGDGDGTVDGCHPNDKGMEQLAAAFGRAVKDALSKSM